MTRIPFVKYHGAGNDFVMIDDRTGQWEPMMSADWIAHICHRRFGIGGDGLILLQAAKDRSDFFMRYYNADGRISTFCGNGGRCIVAFAKSLGVHDGLCAFSGTDGMHKGLVLPDGIVRISMKNVDGILQSGTCDYELDTGSPHFVRFENDLKALNVFAEGRAIRYSKKYPDGINVNFVKPLEKDKIEIRTYERGVEDETFACGTGVVAAALAEACRSQHYSGRCIVNARGGTLLVDYLHKGENSFEQVWLQGPAVEVFQGETMI